MRVKCRYCGERVEKEDAYKDPNKNSYYCSEEHYLATMKKREDFQKEKEEKKQNKIDPVYEEVAEIFGYRIQNSQLFKEMKLWRSICDDEKILAYLHEHNGYIKSKLEKLNSSEYARIRYVSAILKNSLKDYVATVRVEPEKINVDCEIYEPTVFAKKKRRGLSELEDEVS